MRIETELMRGVGPTAVLKLLERSEMYGYELVQALSRSTGGLLELGQSTLYPMLYNLEAKGLVEASWRDSDAGRERKYYRLTPKGKRRLAADTAQWRTVAAAMTSLGILPATFARGACA